MFHARTLRTFRTFRKSFNDMSITTIAIEMTVIRVRLLTEWYLIKFLFSKFNHANKAIFFKDNRALTQTELFFCLLASQDIVWNIKKNIYR